MDRRLLLVFALVAVVAFSGCTSSKDIQTPSIVTEEKSLDILLEDTLNAEVPSYSVAIDVTNLKKGDSLTIEYIAYTYGFASGIYEHMTKVFVFLDDYLKDSGESYDSIRLVAIGWQTGDQYELEITMEELSNFISGEIDFEQWKEMVIVKEG